MGRSEPEIIRKTAYTFRSALASSFASGRVFLLGDAAHLMPPFGGQGMNSGLRDAHNLYWKIQSVLQGHASSRLLETYSEERYPHAAQMILLSSVLGRIVMPTARPVAFLRDLLFHSLNILPAFRKSLTEMKVKPQPRYRSGFLLPNASKESKRLTGLMLPQPCVTTHRGERVLLDDVLGEGFALLRLYESPREAFALVHGAVWQRLGIRYVCVQPQTASVEKMDEDKQYIVVRDVDRQVGEFLRHNQDVFVLVRPDRYVMGVFRAQEVREFEERLQKLLVNG